MAQKGYIKNSVIADLGAPELAAIFKGLLPTNGIINLWDDLACARINDNLVRLSPGAYNLSGYLLGVMQGTTADLVVDSGTAGYNRIDLVVAEFVRNGGGAGVDTLQFKIVKGTSTTGAPADPTLTADDINVEANTTRQEALYRLTITGTTLAAPELMASVLDNLASVVAMLALKAPLASPALTGTPTVPTAAVGTNTTQAASTAFVVAEIPNRVPQASETVAGKIEIATSAEAAAGTDTARAITPSGLRGGLNASGSAPIYACRAWVVFNGVETVSTISAGNVSSITDLGTGHYRINFTTAMPDTGYSISAMSTDDEVMGGFFFEPGLHGAGRTTSSCVIFWSGHSGAVGDRSVCSFALFR